MPGSTAVKERIEQLIAQAPELSTDEPIYAAQTAWLTSAQYAAHLVCPSDTNAYHAHVERILANRAAPQSFQIGQMVALLSRLLEEIEGGLLTSIENHAIAVTFDDFLDHGAEYLKRGRKDEAGVIAGIVFEDTVRRICRVLGIAERGVALDTLITELAKQDILTGLKAKRPGAAAGLRTSAARDRWEEIELGDVAPVIELTRELIGAHLV